VRALRDQIGTEHRHYQIRRFERNSRFEVYNQMAPSMTHQPFG
jgi:hypothetical protein